MFNLSETVLIIDRHLTRSFTVSFQLCRIFPVFKKLLQLSLKRSLGRPIGRDPSASSPYSNRLQVLLSSIRETCPSHRKRLCASRTSMSTTSDCASTSSLDTKSNQRIFKIDRRCLCWMVRSCLTTCEYSVQASLPYSKITGRKNGFTNVCELSKCVVNFGL